MNQEIEIKHLEVPEKMIWAGHVARIWEKRNAYSILVGTP
jgi:hypothetical protein